MLSVLLISVKRSRAAVALRRKQDDGTLKNGPFGVEIELLGCLKIEGFFFRNDFVSVSQ
jgi:hypothetical protein